MSLAINPDSVVAVLLADGWHDVDDTVSGVSAFSIDSYEYVDDDAHVHHGGGDSGICAVGFSFLDRTGVIVAGPLTSILAVRMLMAADDVVIQRRTPGVISATVRDDGGICDVRWTRSFGWTCSCRVDGDCQHISAVKTTSEAS